MNETAIGELQTKNLEAATRLARLSVDNTLRVMTALSTLSRELFELNVRQLAELAAADEQAALALRAVHAQQIARKMIDCARAIAELGNEARIGFSRLLTEQLASGSHGLMDAFQAFFSVLPAQNVNLLDALQLAIERADRAFGQINEVLVGAMTLKPATGPKPRQTKMADKATPAALVHQADSAMAEGASAS